LNLTNDYLASFWAIAAIILLLLIQWLVATKAKTKQKGAIPGKIDPSLGHESFVFRAHRTYMNTLENIPMMLGASFLAILIGANAFWTAIFIWVFVASRLMHMILYYVIATEKNPSPRTYFFSLGLFSNICLLGLCVKTLMSISY
jgi:uncharacterized MAPEG superfamily protein